MIDLISNLPWWKIFAIDLFVYVLSGLGLGMSLSPFYDTDPEGPGWLFAINAITGLVWFVPLIGWLVYAIYSS